VRLDETPYARGRESTASPAVYLETDWHVPPAPFRLISEAVATQWMDRRCAVTRTGVTPPDTYVVRVFLSASTMQLSANGRMVVNGPVAAGTVHVSLPGEALALTIEGLDDSLQWYLSTGFVRKAASNMDCEALLDRGVFGGVYCDTAIEQLALALLTANTGTCLPGTASHFAVPVLGRLFQLAGALAVDPPDPVKVAIPRWRMQRVDAYISQHLGDPISLAAVAAAAGLSPMHFAARFRLATGQRPHHYILRARIEHAKALLVSSARPVIEVAGDAGFRTQAHFTTIFKHYTGATPCAWRRERALSSPL
jgi:AraC family transcriptional regulator